MIPLAYIVFVYVIVCMYHLYYYFGNMQKYNILELMKNFFPNFKVRLEELGIKS